MSQSTDRFSIYGVILGLTLVILACGISGQPDIEATVAAGVAATQQADAIAKTTIEAAIAATQQVNQGATPQSAENSVTPTPVPPITIPAPGELPHPPDQQAVIQVISAEVNALLDQDLTQLKSLYLSGAIIIDRGGTPNIPGDDVIWNGWPNIEQRYAALFKIGFSCLTLVDLSIQMEGNQATATYQGVILDELLYPDQGSFTLKNQAGQWLIAQQELGHTPGYALQLPRDDGIYRLEVGGQHRYEEPWGWDKGDPCEAWRTGNWDDTKPDYRGFNLELLLTNNSDSKVPDNWPVILLTANGKQVEACFYSYKDSGPMPGATTSMTFFTVVEKGDFVEKVILNLSNQVIELCLDGGGNWWQCNEGQ